MRCSLCCRSLPVGAFPRNVSRPRGRGSWCHECFEDQRKVRVYGITTADYQEMYDARAGACDFCGEAFAILTIDHCHETGRVRGLLCRPHNRAIGLLGDDRAGVERALAYLKLGGVAFGWEVTPGQPPTSLEDRVQRGVGWCSRCCTERPVADFHRSTSRSGVQRYCKTCMRMHPHGLTRHHYEEQLARQGGVCALACGRTPKLLAVDHDHQTLRVRGLLCKPCNTGIGQLGDNEEGLTRALEYLTRGGQ